MFKYKKQENHHIIVVMWWFFCAKLEFNCRLGVASTVPNGAGSVRGGGFRKAKLGGVVIKIRSLIQKQPLSHLPVTAPLTQGSLADYNIKCNMKKINRLHNNSSVKCSLPQQT